MAKFFTNIMLLFNEYYLFIFFRLQRWRTPSSEMSSSSLPGADDTVSERGEASSDGGGFYASPRFLWASRLLLSSRRPHLSVEMLLRYIKLFIHHPFPKWWVPLLCDLHMRVNLTYTSVDRRGCSRIETRSNLRVELIIIEYKNIIVNTLAEGKIIINHMYH